MRHRRPSWLLVLLWLPNLRRGLPYKLGRCLANDLGLRCELVDSPLVDHHRLSLLTQIAKLTCSWLSFIVHAHTHVHVDVVHHLCQNDTLAAFVLYNHIKDHLVAKVVSLPVNQHVACTVVLAL